MKFIWGPWGPFRGVKHIPSAQNWHNLLEKRIHVQLAVRLTGLLLKCLKSQACLLSKICLVVLCSPHLCDGEALASSADPLNQ